MDAVVALELVTLPKVLLYFAHCLVRSHRANATGLRPSSYVVCLWRHVLWLNGAS